VQDICLGNCCFLCGARPETRTFNNEHVIPRWLLRRYDLFDKQITLPNGQVHTYGTYWVPCCEQCNSLLGRVVETPISELLDGGFEAITARLTAETIRLLFAWLCLVFIKTHLKDRLLRAHLDPRQGDGKIADNYNWPDLHHVHAVARSPIIGADLALGVIGSICFFELDDPTTFHNFDWIDLSNEQTVALRIGNLGIVSVLNDAGASSHGLAGILKAITGPLTVIQLREVAARMAVANSDLENRPTFGTRILNSRPERVEILARHDARPNFAKFSPAKYGEALVHALREFVDHLDVDGDRDPECVRAHLQTGQVSFLFDAGGVFMRKIVWESRT
jgi:hypothetical protein